jgi:hypothetical protein
MYLKGIKKKLVGNLTHISKGLNTKNLPRV